MANSPRGKIGNGGPNPTASASAPPGQIASVPAPAPLADMNSFIFQSLMEMQKSVAENGAKTDRLIADVSKQNEKIDVMRGQVNFVKGASWIIGALLTITLAAGVPFGIALFNRTARPSATQTITAPASQSPAAPR